MKPSHPIIRRPHRVALLGVLLLAVGAFLRAEAFDLCTTVVLQRKGAATPIIAKGELNREKYEAAIDLAWLLLGGGVVLCTTATFAWLFVPAYRGGPREFADPPPPPKPPSATPPVAESPRFQTGGEK